MIWVIILIVLAIVMAPILLPVLIGTTGLLFTFFKEAFTDPDILIVIFATIAAVGILHLWARSRHGRGRKKKTG